MMRLSSALESSVIGELTAGGRILVSRLHYLGDVILSLPLVRALQERFPASEIDYLTRSDGAAILEGEPGIARVHRVPERGAGPAATWRLVRALRARRYAAAFDLFSNPRSAWLTRLSGARLRVGGDRRGRRMLYTHPIRVPGSIRAAPTHHLYYGRVLGVAGEAHKPILMLSDEERRRGAERLRDLGARSGAPVVGLHPGGKWEVKRWPAPYFVELAQGLLAGGQAQVVVFCGPGEEGFRDAVVGGLDGRAFALPTLPIRETAGVIAALDAMVVNDGGVMHVSVAVGTPTVGIFGSSEPDVWFPYEADGPYRPAVVPITCRPCHSHVCGHLSCLRHLAVERVRARLDEVMTVGARSGAK